MRIKEAIYAPGAPFAPHTLGVLGGPPRAGALGCQAMPLQIERFFLPVARAEKAICLRSLEG